MGWVSSGVGHAGRVGVDMGTGILGEIALAVGAVGLAANRNEGNSCGACVAAIAGGFGGGIALGAIPGSRTI